jgi:hypothetical protein
MNVERLVRVMLLHLFAAFCFSGRGQAGDVVISQIYGGGGNSWAVFKNDFVELYNRTGLPVDLSGWSVQYASATGSTWSVTPLSGLIQPRRYYLIQLGSGGSTGADLPTPDATGTTNMSATAGKVSLVDSTSGRSGACPTAGIMDLVGYGSTANCFEGHPIANLSSTLGAIRSGELDTGDNAADFVVAAPSPRNSSYVPLPVQLVAFTGSRGEPGEVVLQWTTISEVNNFGFYVQRKRSGDQLFSDLPQGFVPGQGTSLVRHDYLYFDRNALSERCSYRLKQVDLDGTANYSDTIRIEGATTGVPGESGSAFALHQNYPNPFNPTTTFEYTVGGVVALSRALSSGVEGHECTNVRLVVFDLLGREVAVLVNAGKPAGSHSVEFDGTGLPSGVYIYQLIAGPYVERRKMMLMK